MLVATGCSDPAAETFGVSGVVTFGGKPVPAGHVGFMPLGKGTRASGKISSDGRYQLQAPAGHYKVTVTAFRDVPLPSVDENSWATAFDAKAPEPYVPSIYGDPESSPISCTVEPIEQSTFDIVIQSRKR
ncbi:MAG: carboxypeptidase-like regulatory domain-containing protein [Planctomycetota bacterium]